MRTPNHQNRISGPDFIHIDAPRLILGGFPKNFSIFIHFYFVSIFGPLFGELWPYDVLVIPPSSRALALHALIISLEPSGKIDKLQNECTEIPNIKKLGSKITKMSFNLNLSTSCHLPPYYSLDL